MAVAALLASGLSACGGSSSDNGGSTSSTAAEKGSHEKAGEKGARERQGGAEGGAHEPKEPNQSAPVSPLQVSGGGSGQFRVKGGDNSIQEYGEESSDGELEAAASALHDFYVARARQDWNTACDLLAKTVTEQIEQLRTRAKSVDKGCAASLAAITPPLPPKVAREVTAVDAGSLRVEGDRGFLIYRGAESAVYAIGMANEDGAWKVGALAGVPLS